MSLTNTPDRYGFVSKTFHWLTALLILILIPLGGIANDLPYDTSEQLVQKAWLFSLHKTMGVTVFFVALARIIWSVSQPKPGLLHPDRELESLTAETVHWLLYGSLVLVPLSGWIHHAATTGFAPIWWPFGQTLPLVPKSDHVAALFAGAHGVLTKVLIIAILLHIAGALKHQIIDKDATLKRMWFGTTDVPKSTPSLSHTAPVITAITLWILALTSGAALGVYTAHGERPKAALLENVQSDWQVQDGSLSITVTQMGADVTGQFAQWTAAIAFDETVPNETEGRVAGYVDVTVSIGSLTLGSVTDQAMGYDFFNATDFPTARFVADIIPAVDGYEARGTLMIKDQSVPTTLPFGLTIDGNSAEMTGTVTLNRMDFGIGNNMPDETSLKFNVEVNIGLTATRAPE